MRLHLLLIEKLTMLHNTVPNFTFGELLYTVLRKSNLNKKPIGADSSWISDISDNDFMTAFEKAIKTETELNNER